MNSYEHKIDESHKYKVEPRSQTPKSSQYDPTYLKFELSHHNLGQRSETTCSLWWG